MKSIVAAIVVAVFLALSAGSALAGEVTGNGKTTPVKDPGVARSDCAFSGLEDDDGGPNGGPGVTPQTWGQIVVMVNGLFGPGTITEGADGPHEAPDGSITGCNAHLYPVNHG